MPTGSSNESATIFRHRRPRLTGDVGPAIERLNRLITDLLAFSGLATESITRTHGWRFLQLGRRIERTNQTAELLSATLVRNIEDQATLCETLLEITDGLMTYRSRYMTLVRPEPVIDLLVTDETNPRSILFQLLEINELLGCLPGEMQDFGLGTDQKRAEELLHPVRMADISRLSRVDQAGNRQSLEDLLTKIIDELPNLSNAIEARYLIHTGVTQALTGETLPFK